MARILIVGAGDVGGRVAVSLASLGHQVWALRRTAPEQRQLLAGVQSVVADVTRPETLRVLPAGIEVVITALSPGESGEAAYQRVYVEGTRNLVHALHGHPVRRHFWVSSTSVYGQHAGEWVDDNTPVSATSPTAKALMEAEAVVHSVSWPSTCIRLAGLYGPGRHWLIRWVMSGKAMQTTPPVWTNRIHVEDAAGFIGHLVTLALQGQPLHNSYIGVDDAPVPQHEVLLWLSSALGLAPLPLVAEPSHECGKRLKNKRLHESGYNLIYPDFREGYQHVIETMRAH